MMPGIELMGINLAQYFVKFFVLVFFLELFLFFDLPFICALSGVLNDAVDF